MIAACGAFLFVPAAQAVSFPFFVGAMFVLATGLCFLETAADTYVNVLGPQEGAPRRLNLAQSFNSVGVFIGPLIGGAVFFGAKDAGAELHSVQITYGIIGIAILLYAVFVSRVRLPEIAEPESSAVGRQRTARAAQGTSCYGVLTQALVHRCAGRLRRVLHQCRDRGPARPHVAECRLSAVARDVRLPGRALRDDGTDDACRTAEDPDGLRLDQHAAVRRHCRRRRSRCNSGIDSIVLLHVDDVRDDLRPGRPGPRRADQARSSIMVMAIGGGVLLPYPMGLIAESQGHAGSPSCCRAACFLLVAWYGWRGAQAS